MGSDNVGPEDRKKIVAMTREASWLYEQDKFIVEIIYFYWMNNYISFILIIEWIICSFLVFVLKVFYINISYSQAIYQK
jgi:hypothetical protein